MNDETDVDDAQPRRPVKSDAAFRTISEVSDDLEVPQHVLRFWESKFPQIKPLKRGGGRRYYRPEDVQLLRRIRDLLYKDGYTIRGVQKLLREQSRGGAAREAAGPEVAPAAPSPAPEGEEVETEVEPEGDELAVAPEAPVDRGELESLLHELLDLRGFLAQARKGGNPP